MAAQPQLGRGAVQQVPRTQTGLTADQVKSVSKSCTSLKRRETGGACCQYSSRPGRWQSPWEQRSQEALRLSTAPSGVRSRPGSAGAAQKP